MHGLGFEQSVLYSAFFYHRQRDVSVVIDADNLLCSGEIEDVGWPFESVP